MSEVANHFWRSKTVTQYQKLAEHWRYAEKLSYDLEYLIPTLRGCRKLYDMACGDGRLSLVLDSVFRFDLLLLSDINPTVMPPPGYRRLRETMDQNVGKHSRADEADAVLWLGAMPFVFDDGVLENLVGTFTRQRLVVRTPCYLSEEHHVCGPSLELGGEMYEAKYRTFDSVRELLFRHFNRLTYHKPYPPHLESRFGTTQWFFEAWNE